MKNPIPCLPVFILAVATLATPAFAQLNVPSDGSDGALNITTNIVIDLSRAVTGMYNLADPSTNGIYDPTQWAVVFKYSSINIQGAFDTNGNLGGNNVTFLNHPSHAPVIWLVQSNVTINGIVSLNGQSSTGAIPQQYTPLEPGPGGFRSGAAGPEGFGAGYGPGGGSANGADAGYAGYYGNPQILPLIGGSGSGAGQYLSPPYSGASAGGAILIVAGGTVTINGQITAVGGAGVQVRTGSGSSGAIRIVANQIFGNGLINAAGVDGTATDGRTRMEANYLSPQLSIFPNAAVVPPSQTPVIFPPANAPTVSVVSVDTQTAPLNPLAAVVSSADIGIQNNNPVNIILQTQNLPIQGVVTLRITPKYATATILNANYVSGNINQATWQVTTTLPQGFCVLQARATAP
jgi:hypothetical protein